MSSIWETGAPSSSAVATQMPPGVKFSPTDGELMGYYLYNYIRRTLPPAHCTTIRRHDLYGDDEPWEIWQRLQSGDEPGDVYAFTELKKKVKSCGGKSRRSGRKVGRSGGNWHGEDVGTHFNLVRRARSPLEKDERWVGTRKRFSYRNPNPKFAGEHTKWILHEFSMRRDDGCSEEEKEVVCMIRNNGSPTGDAIVEVARKSVVAGRKRKLEDYIKNFCSSGSNGDGGSSSTTSKRVCYFNSTPPLLSSATESSNPLPPLLSTVTECSNHLPPLLSTETECSNPLPPLPSTAAECSNPLPPETTNVLPPQQPQPVGEEEDDSETLDIMSMIDFQDGELDWGVQAGSGPDPQSVLEFPQLSSSDHSLTVADYAEPAAAAADIPAIGDDCGEGKTAQEATNEPIYLLPSPLPSADGFEPAAADPVVAKEETDGGGEGKEIVVDDDDGCGRRAADSATAAAMERIVLPWDANYMGGAGFGDLVSVPSEPPMYQSYPPEAYDAWEGNWDVNLWNFGPGPAVYM